MSEKEEEESSGPVRVKSDIPYDPRFPNQNQTMWVGGVF